jgi:hypothetical protein
VQGHLGHVELVLADQLQQQIERAGEVGQPHRETGGSRLGGQVGSHVGGRHTIDHRRGSGLGRVKGWRGHRTTVVHEAGTGRSGYRSDWAAITSRAS